MLVVVLIWLDLEAKVNYPSTLYTSGKFLEDGLTTAAEVNAQ